MFAASKTAKAAAAAAATDPQFNYVTMLLHGDGTNGAQNNTFLDSSTNNFSITRNGNTTQGTFTPYGSNWSNYFDGSGDFLSAPSNTALEILGGSFTIEFWMCLNSSQGNYGLVSKYAEGPVTGYFLRLDTTYIRFYTTAATVDRTYSFAVGTWYHIAIVSNGTTGTIYINGVSQGATFSTNGTQNTISTTQVGRTHTITNDFPGYISNLRIVKGTAVYTSAFTPSTTPLTAITNTSLLTCADNRFIDDSTNNFTITVNGNTSVQRFSPFAPTSAYSTSVIGGSGYFDGTVDSLTVSSNAAFGYGTGDFTIEFWIYLNSTGLQTVFSNLSSDTSTNPHLYISTTIRYFTASADRITGATLSTGQWYHIALCKASGSTRLFINGTQSGSTYTDSNNYGTSAPLGIGTYWSGGSPVTSNTVNGYITDTRVLKGTALYTTTFTPPTAPLTAVTNTQLLTNFTNAGILDNAMMNDLETVGNAQISTSVKKYGTGSMAFDGSGDWLNAISSPNYGYGTGDFTIEFWSYPTSASGVQVFLDQRTGAATSAVPTVYTSSGTIYYYVSGNNRITGSSLSLNQWSHIAICRSGTSTKLFINGTQSGSTFTDTTTYLNAPVRIGDGNDGAGPYPYSGYIDDFRITKGYARYTSNFTPPTAAFPNN